MEDGTGAGVTINPIAFLVIQPDNVKLMPVTHTSGLDKLLDYVPDLFDKINEMFYKKNENKNIENFAKEQQKKSHQNIKENKEIKKNKNNKNIRESQENKDPQSFEIPNNQDNYEYEYDETNENEDY